MSVKGRLLGAERNPRVGNGGSCEARRGEWICKGRQGHEYIKGVVLGKMVQDNMQRTAARCLFLVCYLNDAHLI